MSSAQNCANLFITSTYADIYGRNQKCYELTRDGFSLLVMGFTGKNALEWKLKYIEAFNLMEEKLRNQYGNLEEIITKAVTVAVSETVKTLMPFLTAPQVQNVPAKRTAIICKPKVRCKIDMLPPKIKEQVDDMLCSGEYTSKEISNYIQNKTGIYISYVTLCNYKKANFILINEDNDMQLSLFQEV